MSIELHRKNTINQREGDILHKVGKINEAIPKYREALNLVELNPVKYRNPRFVELLRIKLTCI